jgi:hypothetical protein
MKKLLALMLSILLFAATTGTSFAAYGIQAKTSGCVSNNVLPDSACTPGAVLTTNASVVCKSGYSASVRDVSTATKKKVFAEYGIPWAQHASYEVDHLISLEIGGSNDIANLWPESSVIPDGSFVKDKLENYLHAQVCKGTLALPEAQREIATDWLTYYNTDILHQLAPSTPPTAMKTAAKTVTTPTVATDPETKKSTAGLCHERGTRYYTQTKTFTPYSSLAACLASGGKVPK